jgi:hypothetical protein
MSNFGNFIDIGDEKHVVIRGIAVTISGLSRRGHREEECSMGAGQHALGLHWAEKSSSRASKKAQRLVEKECLIAKQDDDRKSSRGE